MCGDSVDCVFGDPCYFGIYELKLNLCGVPGEMSASLKDLYFFGPVKKIYLYIVILSLFRIFCVFLLSNYNTEYIESIYIYIVDNDDFLFFCSFLQILQPTWNKFCLLAAKMGLLLSFNNGNYIKLSIVSFGKVVPWNKNKNFFVYMQAVS